MDNILSVIGETPQEVAIRISRQVKARRLEMNLTQEGLCVRAGIKLPTYRRFERTSDRSRFNGIPKIQSRYSKKRNMRPKTPKNLVCNKIVQIIDKSSQIFIMN